jgi:hypothetical protein
MDAEERHVFVRTHRAPAVQKAQHTKHMNELKEQAYA